jgi:hypothetical protein
MSHVDQPLPIRRALFSAAVAMACALALMPVLTLAPRLLLWGGPIGPAFALFIAPLIGLFVGAFIAPMSVSLAALLLLSTVFGLTALGRKSPAAKSLWAWALAGLASGAAAGAALSLEIVTFGFELPGTAYSGAATGLICALIARRMMRY